VLIVIVESVRLPVNKKGDPSCSFTKRQPKDSSFEDVKTLLKKAHFLQVVSEAKVGYVNARCYAI